ncbi:hypothetical protein TRAPUB_4923 [Trametes pubescens]|uniref:Uncharacterized protein n=1 Tax=Trametes pubescens TaxID=154538 RepID=A0A1M2VA03_TRAPU|nr:hypothetical protein TRAPUB_4923 [Trametes pubescens]
MNSGSNSNNNTIAPMDTDAQGSQQAAPAASGSQFPMVAPPQVSTSYAPHGVAQQQYPAAYPQVLPSTGNCPLCAEFLRHYTAGASEQSFRDAQTRVQTELQGRFWAHFERHTRSEGGRDRECIAELETRLQTLQAEYDSEQECLR